MGFGYRNIIALLFLIDVFVSPVYGRILGAGSENYEFIKPKPASENKLLITSPNLNTQSNNIISTPGVQSIEETVSEMRVALNEDHQPCSMFDPPTPAFKMEGRRISEEKCLEYIWEVKKEEETTNRVNECKAKYAEFSSIVNGRNAQPAEFPHMGALGWKSTKGDWEFLCGSFLISDKFVLTAAHCQTADEDLETITHPKPKIVRFGVENIINDQYRSPVDVKILKFIIHENYRPLYKAYDIAVVELAKSVSFDQYVRPACILDQQVTTATVTGWGVVDSVLFSKNTSEDLRVAEVDIVPPSQCSKMLRQKRNKYFSKVRRDQICATRLNGSADTCSGDSGGPLQSKLFFNTKTSIYNVIGITSFSFICARPKFPGVYTRVANFIDWIEEKVWNISMKNKPTEDGVYEEKVKVHNIQTFDQGNLFFLNERGSRWLWAARSMVNSM